MVRDAPEHSGVDIPCFWSIGGINVAGDIQVVAIAPDFLFGNQPGKLFDLLGTGGNRIHNPLDIGCHQFIGLANLGKALGSVNKQNIRFFALLAQRHNDSRNTCAKENVGRQANNRLNVVVLNQIAANLAFALALAIWPTQRVTTEQDAMREDNGHDTIRFYMVQVMKQECIGFLLLRKGLRALQQLGKRLPVVQIADRRAAAVHQRPANAGHLPRHQRHRPFDFAIFTAHGDGVPVPHRLLLAPVPSLGKVALRMRLDKRLIFRDLLLRDDLVHIVHL